MGSLHRDPAERLEIRCQQPHVCVGVVGEREKLAGLTVIVNHELHITHNLGVATVRLISHDPDILAAVKDARGLRVEDKGDGEKALDPFCIGGGEVRRGGPSQGGGGRRGGYRRTDELVAPVCLEGVWGGGGGMAVRS